MMRIFAGLLGILALASGWFVFAPKEVPSPVSIIPAYDASGQHTPTVENAGTKPVSGESGAVSSPAASQTNQTNTSSSATWNGVKIYSQADLLAMADNAYADGNVPLGDDRYVTSAPKKGYVYLCNAHKDNPGSAVNGPWIGSTTWNFLKKVTVDGAISWPNAFFSVAVSGAYRVLSGNDLPVGYTTGSFPVARSDDAYQYDSNPNSIAAQTLKQSLPASPTYLATPSCMGGEVGVMSNGVALFNAFDAGLRDAPAHELQDSCSGHPQGSDEYHYHSLPDCFSDIGEATVLGWALDGFPITGPKVAEGKYLTTSDLDECHGIVSAVNESGKEVVTYHYVMTRDFPYSASCFRGKPVSLQVIAGAGGGAQTQSGSQSGTGQAGSPPQEAVSACTGKSSNTSCSFSTPNGTISGTCKMPPNSTSLACVPQ